MRNGIIERTLSDLTGVLEQSIFAEQISRQAGLLQALDPRIKIISFLALLVSTSLSRSLPVLLGLYGLTLFLAWQSSISMSFFIRRVWLFMPFFTGLIALPALFITPGPALITLPLGIVITKTGGLTDLFLLLRVSTSVSFGVLLVLTTPWPALLKALRVLRVPTEFLLILGMTYRYIFLLLLLTEDMFLSRKSRIVGRQRSSDQRRILAATMGTLLNKSLSLSSDVYLAMQARGYRGQSRTVDEFSMRGADWVWGTALLFLAACAVWLGR
jgi:cobalt/nickel transport system permease protein